MSIPDRLGDYKIVEEIGRGGFGIVYRAQQVSLDRPVALKVLYEYRVHTDDEVSRFEREARAAARLDHAAIVSVYSWGEDSGSFFIAQKLVGRGRTAADQLADLRAKPEPPKGYYRQVAECIARVADGLQHAHERGVVHRDIKPSNILLDDREQPFLGDFGLAKVEDGLELSRTGDFAGSPFYMSPEQADSRRGSVDHRSDIYSLGVMLYEMLTLQPPFQGHSSHEIIRKILTEEPRVPSKLAERVPPDLETICLKAMEKARARRYQSAEALAHDLRSFLDGEPISAAPPSTVSRIWRQARRHRQTVGIVTMGVALLVLGFYFFRERKKTDLTAQKLQMAEVAGDIAAGRETTLQATGLQKQLDEAIDAEDNARARELAQTQREWQGIVAEGSKLLLDMLPGIDDKETLDKIGDTLDEDFPLKAAAEKIQEYLRQQPASENEPDPRLAEVTSWLDTTKGFLEGFDTAALGIVVKAAEGQAAPATDVTRSGPQPAMASTPEVGAPAYGPPTSPDGRVGGTQIVPPTGRPIDPDDGPSRGSSGTLRAYPPVQLVPAGGLQLRHPDLDATVYFVPWYVPLRSLPAVPVGHGRITVGASLPISQ